MYFYTFLKPFVQYQNKLESIFYSNNQITNLRTTRNPPERNRLELVRNIFELKLNEIFRLDHPR